jgi:hypothetical protein
MVVADPPELWVDLGFHTEGTRCRVGATVLALGGSGRGLRSWSLEGAGALSELPASRAAAPHPPQGPSSAPGAVWAHPNGVTTLDHVVVTTPDLERTVAALENAGIELRRRREAGSAAEPAVQAFFRLDQTILEVVGPATGSGPGPARLWGLAFVVADLGITAAVLGARLLPAIDAVQPGRRIATLDRSAGSSVPMAFLSPDPDRRPGSRAGPTTRSGPTSRSGGAGPD